jgi:hypothetical protein
MRRSHCHDHKKRTPRKICNVIFILLQWKTLERPHAYILSSLMLVKVKSIDTIKNKVKVTQLDIDDYGSVIPLKELEFNIPADDDSIIQTLKNSSYAAIFTEDSIEENNGIIILANGMTTDELNKEKSKTIDKAAGAKQI